MSANLTTPAALIVEDEAVLLMLVAETMRDAGFAVHEASDGASAIAALAAHPEIEIMISDVRMPGMNGYQVTDAALRLKPELKVLLVTGYSHEPLPKHISDAGIKLLHKPLDMDQLSALAHKMLAHTHN